MMNDCQFCQYAVPRLEGGPPYNRGECHRHAPIGLSHNSFPLISRDSWCGDSLSGGRWDDRVAEALKAANPLLAAWELDETKTHLTPKPENGQAR